MIGFFLEPFHNSIRKQVGKAPKFYFFDTGIVRALSRTLTLELLPSTNSWGDAFEHFIILEMTRLIGYSGNQFRIHFIRTYEDQEIDIVVRRPGKPLLLIKIKSTVNLRKDHLKLAARPVTIFELDAAVVEIPLQQDCTVTKLPHVIGCCETHGFASLGLIYSP